MPTNNQSSPLAVGDFFEGQELAHTPAVQKARVEGHVGNHVTMTLYFCINGREYRPLNLQLTNSVADTLSQELKNAVLVSKKG